MINLQEIKAATAGHTPGPWNADGWYVRTLAQNHYWQIADAGHASRHIDQCIANAALIAAAPDLLVEVERLTAINAELTAANAKLTQRDGEARRLVDFLRAYLPPFLPSDWADRARAFLAGGA